ncbi:hypothetical protein [Nitratireductor sp. GZWM139]|uniref:hypothetical protein n=1 Tax=Nitratireductor sp. GZWM139 TaxID=2950541 RepID=UPI0024BF0758|nr:hypothetical protein [Nitratireductor sp. GZWM139]MDJ1466150.1 hypothetical protein [Nitratireductor sp. GZWM139]
MSSLPAFDRPKESITWARDAIQELDADFTNFFKPKPTGPITYGKKVYGKVVDIDPETGHELHKFKVFERLPSVLSRRTTEALIHIRESWNQAVYAACASIDKLPKRGNLHFPWRSSPTDLNATLKHGPIPAELWDVIRREEPYPTGNGYDGGDDHIKEISKLANDKHTIGLTATARVISYTHPTIHGAISFVSIPAPKWDSVNNEMVMAVVSPGTNVEHNYEVQLQVGLDVPGPLRDVPAIGILNAFADRAEAFTKSIEAECMRISGPQH